MKTYRYVETIGMVRERGIETLSNVKLLSIILGYGTKSEKQVQSLLESTITLRNLSNCDLEELITAHGIEESKAAAIIASFELGRRMLYEKQDTYRYDSASTIYESMRPYLHGKEHEEMWMLCLNNNLGLIKRICLSNGGLTETACDIRVAMKKAIINNATALVFCHNHPSGHTTPSRQDDDLTKKIIETCRFLRFTLIDHIIFTDNDWYSYSEHGKL